MWNCSNSLFQLGIGWDNEMDTGSSESSSEYSNNVQETNGLCIKCGCRLSSSDENWQTESESTSNSSCGLSTCDALLHSCECSLERCGSKGDHSDFSLHSFPSDVESHVSSHGGDLPLQQPSDANLSLEFSDSDVDDLREIYLEGLQDFGQMYLEGLQRFEDDLYLIQPRNLAAGGSSSLYTLILGFGNFMFGTLPLVILLIITVKYIFFGIPPFNLELGSSVLLKEATTLLLFASILLQLDMETFLWNNFM